VISKDECHMIVTVEMLERYTWDSDIMRGLDKMDACLAARNMPPAPYALVKYDRIKQLVYVYPRYDVFYSNADMEVHDILRAARKQMHA
jgi:hypothetical protein